jgi:putative flippase GtrA
MASQKTVWQLVRYGIVGFASNLVGYLVYLFLTAFVLPPKLTMTILYATGALLGFFGNRRFTFDYEGGLSRAAVAYIVVHVGGWAMNFALLYVFTDQLGYPHQITQGIAIFVVAAYLFVALRYFVFPAKPKLEGPMQ